MRILTLTLTVCLGLALCGCGNLLRVKKFDANKPEGIPFYVKTGACVQQTVYGTPYYRLTLKLSNAAGLLSAESLDISKAAYLGPDFQALLGELEKPTPDSGSVLTAWKLLKQRQVFDPYSAADGKLMLLNNSSPTNSVDYGTTYAINQRKPLSGTASADYKLATDGTLTEVQGQVEDTTLATIAAALPISDLIKSAAGIASKAGAAAAGPPEPIKFQLLQEQRYIKSVLSQTANFTLNCPVGKPLKDTDANVAIAVTDVGATDLSADNQAKDTDSIAVSGTIKLPKSMTTPAADGSAAPGAPDKTKAPGAAAPAPATSGSQTKKKKP